MSVSLAIPALPLEKTLAQFKLTSEQDILLQRYQKTFESWLPKLYAELGFARPLPAPGPGWPDFIRNWLTAHSTDPEWVSILLKSGQALRHSQSLPIDLLHPVDQLLTVTRNLINIQSDWSTEEKEAIYAPLQSRLMIATSWVLEGFIGISEGSSFKDSLTGLILGQPFYEYLQQGLARAERYKQPLTLVMIDINHFATFNQENGTESGDKILVILKDAIRDTLRKEDIPARLSSDNFAIIMPRCSEAQAIEVIRRVTISFKNRNHQGVSFCTGTAQAGPEEYPEYEELAKTAQNSLNEAQRHIDTMPGFYIKRAGVEEQQTPAPY
ncbi:MAG: GGDEF domain-containing protein [Magnetococcales bacterium]|nr:GGDEF domain-containing protein [Magnetococcales bacterium]